MACYGIMFMYTKIFYWLRMSQTLAFNVRVLKDVAYETRYFLILLFGIVALFGNAIYILDLGRGNEDSNGVELFPAVQRKKWLGSLVN